VELEDRETNALAYYINELIKNLYWWPQKGKQKWRDYDNTYTDSTYNGFTYNINKCDITYMFFDLLLQVKSLKVKSIITNVVFK
jgi:hypothetical protein